MVSISDRQPISLCRCHRDLPSQRARLDRNGAGWRLAGRDLVAPGGRRFHECPISNRPTADERPFWVESVLRANPRAGQVATQQSPRSPGKAAGRTRGHASSAAGPGCAALTRATRVDEMARTRGAPFSRLRTLRADSRLRAGVSKLQSCSGSPSSKSTGFLCPAPGTRRSCSASGGRPIQNPQGEYAHRLQAVSNLPTPLRRHAGITVNGATHA